jgi:hypothetical protein
VQVREVEHEVRDGEHRVGECRRDDVRGAWPDEGDAEEEGDAERRAAEVTRVVLAERRVCDLSYDSV